MPPAACTGLETQILTYLLLSPRKLSVLAAGELLLCSSRDQEPHPALGSIGAMDARRWSEDCWEVLLTQNCSEIGSHSSLGGLQSCLGQEIFQDNQDHPVPGP